MTCIRDYARNCNWIRQGGTDSQFPERIFRPAFTFERKKFDFEGKIRFIVKNFLNPRTQLY